MGKGGFKIEQRPGGTIFVNILIIAIPIAFASLFSLKGALSFPASVAAGLIIGLMFVLIRSVPQRGN
jgi:hypothetical protein